MHPTVTGIGAGIDSFYEYALKWYVLSGAYCPAIMVSAINLRMCGQENQNFWTYGVTLMPQSSDMLAPQMVFGWG
jgi:hypothetical protein